MSKPCCPRCRHRGYWRSENDMTKRPQFTCDACGFTWLCGDSGGEYVGHEMGVRPRAALEVKDE
jgi:hypothetical protein